MNRRLTRLTAALALLLAAPGGASAMPDPLFYERVLGVDVAGDFTSANRALDLQTLFVSETYKFDLDTFEGNDVVTIRLTPEKFDDLVFCSTPPAGLVPALTACRVRYDVYFESGGRSRHVNATFGWSYGETPGPRLESANVTVRHTTDSLLFVLPRVEFGLWPGTSLTRLWATSSLEEAGHLVVQDRLPGDNQNTPANLHPEFANLFADPARMEGTYAFFDVDPVTPLTLRSVRGNGVRFEFTVQPAAGVTHDTITVLWDAPPQWSLVPSRGETSGRARGVLTNLNGGEAMPFAFTAVATDLVEVGQRYPIVMQAFSQSGGRVDVPTIVEVTGPHYESPDHVFLWASAGPLHAGRTETLRLRLVDAAGAPLPGLPVQVDALQDGRRRATVPAVERDGAYEASYQFPEAGPWTVDAYVAELEPAPHHEFAVHVEATKRAPGFEVGLLALGLALGVGLRRPRA